ncbi:hypothetical protein PVX_001620 [Plasmodium vivax]|uniref:Uncharacterized protein n=1 Tax=Plasmodium vivax (strain Salvador I) TaxID=126793 RepID=A5KC92_PLAVS|nr:hypothetical protein PVX_001620 [Plasmodium vivax]EDL42956.1 hypothetical protein PVX_001620 [Plasmodium vivax]|eukprot:XP_001612683.1 hypothetical protein [Plasmodium vivax Sal-1]
MAVVFPKASNILRMQNFQGFSTKKVNSPIYKYCCIYYIVLQEDETPFDTQKLYNPLIGYKYLDEIFDICNNYAEGLNIEMIKRMHEIGNLYLLPKNDKDGSTLERDNVDTPKNAYLINHSCLHNSIALFTDLSHFISYNEHIRSGVHKCEWHYLVHTHGNFSS